MGCQSPQAVPARPSGCGRAAVRVAAVRERCVRRASRGRAVDAGARFDADFVGVGCFRFVPVIPVSRTHADVLNGHLVRAGARAATAGCPASTANTQAQLLMQRRQLYREGLTAEGSVCIIVQTGSLVRAAAGVDSRERWLFRCVRLVQRGGDSGGHRRGDHGGGEQGARPPTAPHPASCLPACLPARKPRIVYGH
jgi:hypothetical protein